MSLRVIQFQKIGFSFWNDVYFMIVYFMISVLLIVIFRDESFT